MTKAEDKLENNRLKYIEYVFKRHGIDPDSKEGQLIYYAYGHGYHQAEKDLELTWEDVMIIHKCIKDAMNFHLYKMMEGFEGQKAVYQEELKRFREGKGKQL